MSSKLECGFIQNQTNNSLCTIQFIFLNVVVQTSFNVLFARLEMVQKYDIRLKARAIIISISSIYQSKAVQESGMRNTNSLDPSSWKKGTRYSYLIINCGHLRISLSFMLMVTWLKHLRESPCFWDATTLK